MPSTLRLNANRPEDMQRAAEILKSGGLVAFPTETVYGLGANALSAEAVRRIFEAKQRPSWDPLIVHLHDAAEIGRVSQLEDSAFAARVKVLGHRFWPGPLTVLLPRSNSIPDEVTAGRATVGVRVPGNAVARELLRLTRLPLAAPSANRFGHVSPTCAEHVLNDLDGRIDAVLDGGPTAVGIESTVVDPAQTPMVIYRSGAVTAEMLRTATGVKVHVFTGNTNNDAGPPESLPSPGVGIRHYAPDARVILSEPSEAALRRAVAEQVGGGTRVGVLLPGDWSLECTDEPVLVEPWGRWSSPESLARELFAALRRVESTAATVIVCPLPEPGGVSDAVRDRLLKAARPR